MAKLHLGSGDDGLLLGCVGLDAVARRRAPAAPAHTVWLESAIEQVQEASSDSAMWARGVRWMWVGPVLLVAVKTAVRWHPAQPIRYLIWPSQERFRSVSGHVAGRPTSTAAAAAATEGSAARAVDTAGEQPPAAAEDDYAALLMAGPGDGGGAV
jgi:hypothetical protein